MSRYESCPCPTRPSWFGPYTPPPVAVPYAPPAVSVYTPPVAALPAPPALPTSAVTGMEATTDSSTSTKPLLSGDHITYIIVVVVFVLVTSLVGFLRWYCRARMRQQQSSAIPTPDPVTSTPNALITFGPE